MIIKYLLVYYIPSRNAFRDHSHPTSPLLQAKATTCSELLPHAPVSCTDETLCTSFELLLIFSNVNKRRLVYVEKLFLGRVLKTTELQKGMKNHRW